MWDFAVFLLFFLPLEMLIAKGGTFWIKIYNLKFDRPAPTHESRLMLLKPFAVCLFLKPLESCVNGVFGGGGGGVLNRWTL